MRGRAPHDVGEAHGGEDAAPSPGRASRTAAIQRRASASLPMSASPSPVARAVADDPFALHLPTAPIQARLSLAPAAEAAAPATPSSGQPLEPALRADMERGFGADFGSVRVHQGGEAAALGAVAYTQGESVHFQPGAYDPGSASGRELVGHELAHVVQQREGRVATPQAKGAPINADPALEAEADDLGGRVARGEVVAQGSGATAAAPGVVQRRITLGDKKDASAEEVLQALTELGVLGDSNHIYETVLRDKPEALRQKPALKFFDAENPETLRKLVTSWVNHGETNYTYAREVSACTKLLEDAFRYLLHSEHGWREIGVAEYMTGDATGLALAPLADPTLTINVLTGDQRKKDGKKEAVRGPTFLDKQTEELPPYFMGAKVGGNIVTSDTNKLPEFGGTQDRYGKEYNQHVGTEVKPWAKETWEATKVIGEAFEDKEHPERRELLRAQMQLGNSEQDELAKQKIAEYKETKLKPQIGTRPCVFLWGRTSGKKGGAHKELDSHQEMMVQLAKLVATEFAGHQLVIVGDKVLEPQDLADVGLSNPALFLGEFWNDGEYGQYMKERNAQRYLFQLFHEQNQAVSIGMRSGSLEGMALLGLRVIFLDDKGNNAEERMEFWAGDGAKDRGAKVKEGGEAAAVSERLTEHEQSHEKGMPNYKRVATLQKLGNQIDARKDLLTRAGKLFNDLLLGVDDRDAPICDDVGNERGNAVLADKLGHKYDATVLAGRMPDDPVLLTAFLDDLEALLGVLAKTEYSKNGSPIRSAFLVNLGAWTRVRGAVDKDFRDTEPGGLALANLDALAHLTDATGLPVVADHESTRPGGQLIGPILKPLDEGTAVDLGHVTAFNKAYAQRESALGGKPATPAAKFQRAQINGLVTAVQTLGANNLLQPDELQQITFLTKYLSARNEV